MAPAGGRGSRGGRSAPSALPAALPALFLLLALAASGCTFERRADTGNGEAEADTARELREAILRDSVRATVDAFDGALRRGDQARAVGLLHADATLYDEESGHRWDPGRADSLLPGPMERDDVQEELRWERVDSRIEVYEGAALVVRRYRASISREETPWTAMETYVLVRTERGWRIRHLHRSRGLGPES